MFSAETYIARRKALKKKVSGGLILLLGNVDVPMNYADNTYHFRQDSSFLYFFGLDIQGLAGVLDVDSGEEVIFGNDVDIEDIIWMGPQVPLKEKAKTVGINRTEQSKVLFDVVMKAIQSGRKIHILPPYRAENKLFLSKLLGILPSRL